MRRDEMIGVLKGLLADVLRARFDGAAYAKLSRAHGYADGYMRALLDAGIVGKDELLVLIGDERRRFVEAESMPPPAAPAPRTREAAA